MIVLSPELASRMLNVWDRRKRDDPATVYSYSLLEVACGALDVRALPERRMPRHVGKSVAAQRRRDTEWLE